MKIKHRNEILAQIESAFSDCVKPDEFVDASHCEECAEHNETLSKTSRDEIGLEELGMPGWDPICFVKPEGFLYYFPAMVRLVFDESTDAQYLSQFLFHCTYEGENSRFFSHFSREQVRATADLMRFLTTHWKDKLEACSVTRDAETAVQIWERLEQKFDHSLTTDSPTHSGEHIRE